MMVGVDALDLVRRNNDALRSNQQEAFLTSLSTLEREYLEAHLSIGSAKGVAKPTLLVSKDLGEVLESPAPSGSTWGAHRAWVQSKVDAGHLPQSALDELERSTEKLARIVGSNEVERLHGLVIGYVQSGKTAHYTGMIARAIDAGYSAVIVLSGILNDLRTQTQERLTKDLVGWHKETGAGIPPEACIPTLGGRPVIEVQTSLTKDFNTTSKHEIAERFVQARQQGKVILMVVKKNVTVLEHLKDGLKACGPELDHHRLLLIDDEADHATVNTGGSGSDVADAAAHEGYVEEEGDSELDTESNPSRTNEVLRKILNHFPRFTYIGYTATPFANVLIEPESNSDASLGPTLYPRDFIHNMKRPSTYYGPTEFFGTLDQPETETEAVCFVSDEEVASLAGLDDAAEDLAEDRFPSLAQALDDFLLTGLAREIRNECGMSTGRHHTMLIHVSRLNVDQAALAEKVGHLVNSLAMSFEWGVDADVEERLRRRWQTEFAPRATAVPSWDQIHEKLRDSSRDWNGLISIQTINSQNSEERLVFGEQPSWTVAIGGNKLSRGLTLEGLCISYFVRRTRMYDSLMQMGRWFGYRPNYGDLVRVHTTPELMEWFRWVILAEEQVRMDVARYAMTGATPLDLAVRIPLHPERALRPTSSLKMKQARVSVLEWTGRTAQSIRLPVDDPHALRENVAALTEFVIRLSTPDVEASQRMESWGSVSSELVAQLLESLKLPEAAFDGPALAAYIREHLADTPFVVAHPGTHQAMMNQDAAAFPLNDPAWPSFTPRYIVRSQMKHIAGDVRVVSQPADWEKINEIAGDDRPRLMFYLIAPGSKPKPGSERRAPLPNHGLPIVALAIGFPGTSTARIKEVVHVDGIRGTPDV